MTVMRKCVFLHCFHKSLLGPLPVSPSCMPPPPTHTHTHIQVCWAHVHYDEAFSSLREASCKSFCRLHIGPEGNLTVYTLALDEVPTRLVKGS